MNTYIEKDNQIEKIDNSCVNYKYVYGTRHSKFIKLGNWLEKESIIFKHEADGSINNKPNFKRGEIIKKVFWDNIRCICSKDMMDVIKKEIINYLIK